LFYSPFLLKQKTTDFSVVGGSEQLSRIVGLFKYIATLQPFGWGPGKKQINATTE